MILPDGYSGVSRGKIAAIVIHLEMLQHPALLLDPEGAWTLRHLHAPDLAWFREFHRRVGEDWLWFSWLRMSDAELAAIIHVPRVEVYALVHDGRDEGLLELDSREPNQCEIVFFGVTANLIGSGAGRFQDGNRAVRFQQTHDRMLRALVPSFERSPLPATPHKRRLPEAASREAVRRMIEGWPATPQCSGRSLDWICRRVISIARL